MARKVKYKGIPFRSETEGRWAHVFDSLGWEWQYEPETLFNYIPDFVLCFKNPLLFEVKPAYHPMACMAERSKVVASGWSGEAVVSCVTFMRSEFQQGYVVGILAERQKEAWDWSPAEIGWCRVGQHWGIHHQHGSYHCRTCGAHDGDNTFDYSRWRQLEEYSKAAYRYFRYEYGE